MRPYLGERERRIVQRQVRDRAQRDLASLDQPTWRNERTGHGPAGNARVGSRMWEPSRGEERGWGRCGAVLGRVYRALVVVWQEWVRASEACREDHAIDA